MNITVKTIGFELSITAEANSNYDAALQIFEDITGKVLKGMELFADGKPVKGTDTIAEGTQEITAVKAKHSSAAKGAVNVTVKTLGLELSVSCEDGTCEGALKVFKKITDKVLDGMDIFKNGKPVADVSKETVAEGDEILALKSKHASA